MAKLPKLVDLGIEETSGVHHPAHMEEGWIVMKAFDQQAVTDVLDRIRAATTDNQEAFVENDNQDILAETQDALAKANERIAELESSEYYDEELDEVQEILKSLPEPIVKMISDARDEAEQALTKASEVAAELQAERASRADEHAIAKAANWVNLAINPSDVGPMLRRLSEVDAVLAKAVEDALDGANAQAESAGMFAEIGKSATSIGGSAYGEISALAKAAVESGTSATFEQAVASIAGNNTGLYNRYLVEKGA